MKAWQVEIARNVEARLDRLGDIMRATLTAASTAIAAVFDVEPHAFDLE
jgi:hypothetical protein